MGKWLILFPPFAVIRIIQIALAHETHARRETILSETPWYPPDDNGGTWHRVDAQDAPSGQTEWTREF